jgi:hypothetical protein
MSKGFTTVEIWRITEEASVILGRSERLNKQINHQFGGSS